MNDNVVDFPGKTYGKINPAKIAKALYEEVDIFDTLLVCGFTKDGQFYLASSEGEIKENLWQFAQAASLWSHLPILPFAKQPNDA